MASALLVAFTVVLALLLPAAPASGAALPVAQTRVEVSALAAPDVVGVHECTTAGQRPVRGSSQPQVAAGSCVAAEGLTGVPRAPMDRALARLDGLRVGDKRVVQSVDAFGSRAGSTFRGRGPTASSDLDLLLRTNPALMSSRSGPWIDDVLGKISKDFEAEAGFPLSLHRPGLPDVFESSLKGTPLVRVFDRVG